MLEVGPKDCLRNLCQSLPNIQYVGIDLNSPYATVRTDLTQLSFASDVFDMVICFHVLEHIPYDTVAMKEILSVLKPKGMALIQVPINGEHTFENPAADRAEKEEIFGQRDHVRFYGLDIRDRLAAVGFDVMVESYVDFLDHEIIRRYALTGDDRVVLVCHKFADHVRIRDLAVVNQGKSI